MSNYIFPEGAEIWEPVDIAALLCTKMSPDDWRPVTGTAIVLAESGGNPLIIGPAIWKPGMPTHLSFDLGLFQLNSYYQTVVDPYPSIPKIPLEATFDPLAAWEHVWKLINVERKGWNYDWSDWVAYVTGAYDRHVRRALDGVNAYRAFLGMGPL